METKHSSESVFRAFHHIRKNGATVLFVSHSASAILELCDRAILLESGECLLDSTPKKIVDEYQRLIYAPADKINEIKAEIKKL